MIVGVINKSTGSDQSYPTKGMVYAPNPLVVGEHMKSDYVSAYRIPLTATREEKQKYQWYLAHTKDRMIQMYKEFNSRNAG